jgi:dihydroflavonol-4-reductase
VVDVRDVALAHLKALKVPEARNQRFLIVGEGMYWQKFGIYLNDEFGKYYYITTKRLVSEKILDFLQYIIPRAKLLAVKRGPEQICNTEKSKTILGMKYRSGREALIDMTYWMIDVNYIPNKLP